MAQWASFTKDGTLRLYLIITLILVSSVVFILSFRKKTTVVACVQNRPVAIAPIFVPDGNLASLSERWFDLSRKMRHDRPFLKLADLLHHVGNGLLVRISDSQATAEHRTLLSELLEGNLSTPYIPTTPWMFRGIDGRPHVCQGGDPGADAHPSQLLSELAAFDIPSSQIVRSGSDQARVMDLVESLREDFHLEGEIEWKAMAVARYAPTNSQWVNRWGHTFDFDLITSALLNKSLTDCSCRGTHVLQAIVVLSRVDASVPILSQASRDSISDRIKDTIKRLQLSQRPSGYWAPDWASPHPNRLDYERDHLLFTTEDFALATGHHLEWIDLLDSRFPFPEATRRAAIAWCGRLLEHTDTETIANNFCAYSHCFRALTRAAVSKTWPEG